MAKATRHRKRVSRRKVRSVKRTARKRSRAVRSRKRVVTRKRIITRKRVIKRKSPPKRTPPKRKAPKHKRPPRPPRFVEYSVNVSYRNKHRPGSAISLQFSVMAKPGLSRDEITDAIIETITNEGEAPDGFKVKIIHWKGGTVPRDVPWGTIGVIASDALARFHIQ